MYVLHAPACHLQTGSLCEETAASAYWWHPPAYRTLPIIGVIWNHSMTGRQHRMGYLGDLPAGLAGCAACSADCTARLAAQGIRAIILPSLSVTLDATPCRTAPMISSAAFRILQRNARRLSAAENHDMPSPSNAAPTSIPCYLIELCGNSEGSRGAADLVWGQRR